MSNPKYQEFWEGIKKEYFRIQKVWIKDELVKFNPEEMQPKAVLLIAKEAVRQGLVPKSKEQWEKDQEIQDCLSVEDFAKKVWIQCFRFTLHIPVMLKMRFERGPTCGQKRVKPS